MPYVQRDDDGIIVGLFSIAQTDYADEFLADDDAEIVAFLTPTPAPAHLNNGGLVRFTGASPPVVLESIRMSSVTRVSKGRYRSYHGTPYSTDQYSAIPAVFDANPRIARITARTETYVEVRVTDLSGAVQDPEEVTLKTERVITP